MWQCIEPRLLTEWPVSMAHRWPPLVTWVTGISAAAAGVRAVALARVLSRCGRRYVVCTPAMQRALDCLHMACGTASRTTLALNNIGRAHSSCCLLTLHDTCVRKRIALWWRSIEATQGVHAGRRRYTPGFNRN